MICVWYPGPQTTKTDLQFVIPDCILKRFIFGCIKDSPWVMQSLRFSETFQFVCLWFQVPLLLNCESGPPVVWVKCCWKLSWWGLNKLASNKDRDISWTKNNENPLVGNGDFVCQRTIVEDGDGVFVDWTFQNHRILYMVSAFLTPEHVCFFPSLINQCLVLKPHYVEIRPTDPLMHGHSTNNKSRLTVSNKLEFIGNKVSPTYQHQLLYSYDSEVCQQTK